MTREQIVSRVMTNTGRTDKASLAGDAIREALIEAGSMHRFQSMYQEATISFAAGSGSVALPEGTFQVLEVRVQNGPTSYSIQLRPKRWITRHYPNPAYYAAGYPYFAYTEGGKLYYLPVSNADYVGVASILVLPDLVEDLDTLNPNYLMTYVIAYATAEVYRSVEMFDEAAQWDVRAAQRLQLAIKADNMSGEEQIADQFPDRGGSGEIVEPYFDPFYGFHDSDRGV